MQEEFTGSTLAMKLGHRVSLNLDVSFIHPQGISQDLKGAQAPPNGSLSGDLRSGGRTAERKVGVCSQLQLCLYASGSREPMPRPGAQFGQISDPWRMGSLIPAIFPRIQGLGAHHLPGEVPTRAQH